MDEPALEIECPHCGAVFNVADGPAGRQVTCPVCRGAVTVLDVQEGAPDQTATATEPARPELEIPPAQVAGPPAYSGSEWSEHVLADDSGPCLVCCAHERKLNPLELRPLLHTFTGMPVRDAARQVTHGMGILAEGVSPDTARAMVEALEAKGIEAFTVPAGSAPEQVDTVQIHSVYDCDERGLHVQVDAKGTVRGLNWDSVVAGVCTKERFGARRKVDYDTSYNIVGGGPMGVPMAMSRSRRHVTVERPPMILTLVLHDGKGGLHTMKVGPRHVRYAYLGDRILEGHDPNFALFLTDVGRHARGAYFPPSYIQAAAGHPVGVREVTGRVEYDNYLRWAVCCAVAQARGASQEGG